MVGRTGMEAGPGPGARAEPGAAVAEVRRLLAAGDSKAALKQARALHKQVTTSDSEAALVDACIARVRGLLGRGLHSEAHSLLELLPRARAIGSARAMEVARVLAAFGEVGPLVEPLSDPALSEAQRRLIEASIEQVVADPAAIAECPALPQDHPLRRGAAAISQALTAVTSGAVAREPQALDTIPRRGAMAGWKLLVRAIHLVARGDGADCLRCLAMIDPRSAPGQLIPVLRAMAQPGGVAGLAGPAVTLLRQVQPDQARLRQELERLDRATRSGDLGALGKLIRGAIAECQRVRPDLVDHLRQRISVLGFLHDVSINQVRDALGKPTPKDARFWRMFAVALEMRGNPPQAAAAWDRFIRHAVHQGWFSAEGPDAAGILAHMAGLMSTLTRAQLAAARRFYANEFDGFAGMYGDQPKSIRELGPARGERPDLYFLEPDELYRRASLGSPRAELFAAWLAWAEKHDPGTKKRQEAAEVWHEAIPDDARPLVALMDAAERRGALKLALQYLARAEALDTLNPQVRRARFRLCVATALRHLGGGNGRLVGADLRALDAMPQAAEGDRRALVEALRAVAGLMAGELGPADGARTQASGLLGSEAGADMLIAAVAAGCGLGGAAARLCATQPSAPPTGSLATGVARAIALAGEGGLRTWIPMPVQQRLVEDLDAAPHADAGLVLRLAEWALREDEYELAHSAAGAGLRAGGATPLRARLLLARAMALPDWMEDRKIAALRAAGTVARHARDESTAATAFQEYRGFADPWGDDNLDEQWKAGLDHKQLQAVIDVECGARAYPRTAPKRRRSRRRPMGDLFFEGMFDVAPPKRRAGPRPEASGRSGAARLEGQEEIEQVIDELSDRDIEQMGSGVPAELGRVLMKMAARHMRSDGKMPPPEVAMRENPDLARELAAALAAFKERDERGPPGPRCAGKQRKRRSR